MHRLRYYLHLLQIRHLGSIHVSSGLSHISLSPDSRPTRTRYYQILLDWWRHG